jgi:predicted anti-sigma-YlaC factor YlaD
MDYRVSLGAYVLGALPPGESAEVHEHLKTCADCREELNQLFEVQAALALMSDQDGFDEQDVQDELMLRSLFGTVAGERRKDRRHKVSGWVLAAAAGLVAIVLGIGLGVSALSSPDSPSPEALPPGPSALRADVRTVHAKDATTGVEATAVLTPEPWGTSAQLTVTGVPAGVHCRIIGITTGDQEVEAGSWTAPDKPTGDAARVPGAMAVPLSNLDRVEIVAESGQRLISIPVH